MTDGAHVRLMVTRGVKKTPNQDPRFVIGNATVVIVAEYKTPHARGEGARAMRSSPRPSAPAGPTRSTCGSTRTSRLNLIQALIQAINAGADEALMLDPRGFVASCNSTNFFIVRGARALDLDRRSTASRASPRRNVIDAWRKAGNVARECDFTLAQVYSADEAFVTGTLGGVTPVTKVDGRLIADGKAGKVTKEASDLYLRSVGAA